MKVKQAGLLLMAAVLLLNVLPSSAQQDTIHVYAGQTIKHISPFLTGACIEDVNHEIYGGIYSQMIFGESFEEGPMVIDPRHPGFDGLSGTISCIAKRQYLEKNSDIRSWQPFRREQATGQFNCFSRNTFNGRQSQTITFLSGNGEIGIENQGLNRWGLNLVNDKSYEGYLWVKADKEIIFYVSLESKNGSMVYAEKKLEATGKSWQKIDFELIPGKSDTSGRFTIKLKDKGSLDIGHAFLQPGSWGRFKDLPVRKDVVLGLKNEGIKVLRYGGSMVNAPEYRWKNMVGPRDRRPPYNGSWYEYSSNGWGIIDFVDLCQAAGFECIPAMSSDESEQDILDFVEYMNGPATTKWGKIRSDNGHQEPYRLKYIQIGNEQMLNSFYDQLEALSDAIWKMDNEIQIIVGMSYKLKEDIDKNGEYFKKIMDFAESRGHEIWFDAHVWNQEPNEPDLAELEHLISRLDQLSDHKNFKVCILEENATNHSIRRALGHAHAINRFERMSHQIPFVCAANCLQPNLQNDNFWDQGFLFLSPSQVWGQPPYYVTQMISQNYLPEAIRSECSGSEDVLDVTAKKSEDGKQLNIQVLNTGKTPVESVIVLNGFVPSLPALELVQIKGDIDDINTPEDPERIIPWSRDLHFEAVGGTITYTFPPLSFTILKIK